MNALPNLSFISQAVLAASRVNEMVDRVPGIDSEDDEKKVLSRIKGSIYFKDVHFSYPSRPESLVLREFSLRIRHGETVALVGGSGSGKSTVVALLERFYDPVKGNILLDGHDIKKLHPGWLRSQMGLVNQEPILFATTIQENILFGNEEASTKHVERAAMAANIHDFIKKLPNGYQTQEAQLVRSLIGDRMSLLIQISFSATIAFIVSLIVTWRLAIVIISIQPLIIGSFYSRSVLMKTLSAKARAEQRVGSQLASESIINHRTITAFSSQRRILTLFAQTMEGPKKEIVKQSWFSGIGLCSSQFLTTAAMALTYWYGGKLLNEGLIKPKHLFQAFFLLMSTGKNIADAGSMSSDIAKGGSAIRSVFEILDRKTEIDPVDPKGIKLRKPINGKIELDKIFFTYQTRPDQPIFRGLSLKIEAGKTIALVGPSGSGKSTVLALIERFYDPQGGTLLIDGRDIRSYNLRKLRSYIALVSQEPTLFAGTIRDNIAHGNDSATEAEIRRAAIRANAHQFISSLKQGYDTYCGERGVQLSGGQKQRIALARAILKDPAILLLDEATSALDSMSENLVQEALEKMMVERTCVVVAHRLATIQKADTVAVINKGKIAEEGSHRNLIALHGIYYSLVKTQGGTSPYR
ncbi:unnamed protein product [Linum tenue]|uniref:Uncharacterized protein n=1 Tax=Linum tenue TaxID=586396 RepID=A0AAV0PG32_9ROSI|nr:unnamed protein product [Linum tenue]